MVIICKKKSGSSECSVTFNLLPKKPLVYMHYKTFFSRLNEPPKFTTSEVTLFAILNILDNWNGYPENVRLSLSRVLEISGQYFLLRTDILQKKVVGCPFLFLFFHPPNVHLISAATQDQPVRHNTENSNASQEPDGKCRGV